MKKFIVSGVLCVVAAFGGTHAALAAEATTTAATPSSTSDLLAKIQGLMKLIADLKAQLETAHTQIEELATTLHQGAQGDDVKKAQEVLATDPTIFPVKPTGFFGPITTEAIKKFQTRFGLPATGVLDDATRAAMKEFRGKKDGEGHLPLGLIKSGEMHDKMKMRHGSSTESFMHKEDNNQDEQEQEQEHGFKSSTAPAQQFRGDMIEHASSTERHGTSTHERGDMKNGTSTREHGDMKDSSSTVAALATKAVADAKAAVAKFEAGLTPVGTTSTSSTASSTPKHEKHEKGGKNEGKKATKKLAEAKRKLADAEKKLADGKYKGAIEKAREVLKMVAKQTGGEKVKGIGGSK